MAFKGQADTWPPSREIRIDPKQIGRLVAGGIVLLLLLSASVSSWYTVEPE